MNQKDSHSKLTYTEHDCFYPNDMVYLVNLHSQIIKSKKNKMQKTVSPTRDYRLEWSTLIIQHITNCIKYFVFKTANNTKKTNISLKHFSKIFQILKV